MATPFVRVAADGTIAGGIDGKFSTAPAGQFNTIKTGASGVPSQIKHHAEPVPGADGTLSPADLSSQYGGELVAVELTAGVTYSFAYRGTADGVEDPFLLFYDPSGRLVTYDDDGGLGRTSLITFTAEEDGTHLLLATSWYSIAGEDVVDSGGYTLNWWVNDPAHDAADTRAEANAAGRIALGTTYGSFETEGDVDVYRVNLTEGMFYNFTFAGGIMDDADWDKEDGETIGWVELYDANGNFIDSFVNYETTLGYFAQEGGTYYVRVRPLEPDMTGGYTLDVEEIDPADRSPLDAIEWVSADPIAPNPGDGDVIYVYFAEAGENFGETADNGHSPMRSFGWQQHEIEAVMHALNTNYSPVTGYRYEITDDPAEATFRMITTTSELYGAYAYPRDPDYGDAAGIVVFNIESGGWTIPASLDPGGYSYAVILHELGHAHGLAHPHDDGGGSEVLLGVTDATGSYGIYDLNQGVYTVMSYNDAYVTGPNGETPFTRAHIGYGWSGSLSAFDIAMLQQLYGTGDAEHNPGANTYELQDANATGTFYSTILDTGGVDAIVYEGERDAQIDLTAATLDYSPTGGGVVSFVEGVFGGFTIANGSLIENARSGSGDDALLGNAVANLLESGDGDDVLMGRGGDDTLRGGSGSDTASYADAAAAVTVDLAADSASGGDGNDTLDSIENATGSKHDDTLLGDDGDNVLDGGLGNDTLNGRGGRDTASYATAAAAVIVSLATGTATGGAGADTLSNIENLEGSAHDDSLTGDLSHNLIIGNAGDDRIDGGAGIDTVSYAGAAEGVEVDLAEGWATGGDGDDELISIENLIGSAYGDTFAGTSGNNVFEGGGGADTVSYANASGGVVINLASDTVTGAAGADSIRSVEIAVGSAFADTIIASDDLDVVTLGGGNDIFVADAGTKMATKAGRMSVDVITDFDASGNDVIDLGELGRAFTWRGENANKKAGDLSYKTYGNVNAAESALGIEIDGIPGAGGVGGPVTVVFGNMDGGAPDFAIVLLGSSGVDPSDFIWG